MPSSNTELTNSHTFNQLSGFLKKFKPLPNFDFFFYNALSNLSALSDINLILRLPGRKAGIANLLQAFEDTEEVKT